jgi:ferric-dicitrate binding protein FerR (iron transport regulator)
VATLPPDLDRLGQQLAGAAGTQLAVRRRRAARRRRVTRTAVAAAVAFAVLAPGPLGTGVRDLARTDLAGEPPGCRLPDGATLQPPACDAAFFLHRPYAWR